MGQNTNVSWADDTWNPWIGCSKVSPGCKNCYASVLVNRFGGDFSKRVRASTHTFNSPLRWNKKPWVCDNCGRLGLCNKSGHLTTGMCECIGTTTFHRRRVFLGSLMDWLDPEVPVEWLADALDIIRRCPGLDFLMLTKRPEMWLNRIKQARNWHTTRNAELAIWLNDWLPFARGTCPDEMAESPGKPPPNVWVGTSVEDQKRADERIPELLKIPAKVRFLSVEPLLEKVDLDFWYDACEEEYGPYPGSKNPTNELHWVIVGGESGPHRRDCGVDAIVSVAEQCQEAGVPCFVKQDCAAKPGQQGRIAEAIWNLKQFPA